MYQGVGLFRSLYGNALMCNLNHLHEIQLFCKNPKDLPENIGEHREDQRADRSGGKWLEFQYTNKFYFSKFWYAE